MAGHAAGTDIAACGAILKDATMNPTLVKPVADPFDDMDRVTPVDSLMARQDRADLPGNRSDQPGNDENDPDNNELDAKVAEDDEVDGDLVASALSDENLDPDLHLAIDAVSERPGNGPDDDEPIEEIERMGDDSLTGPG